MFIEDKISHPSYYKQFEDLSGVLSRYASSEDFSEEKRSALIYNADFLNFLKYSPAIIALIDFKRAGYVFISDNVEEHWGYKAEEFIRLGLVKTITIFPVSQNEIIINKIFPLMFESFEKYAVTGDVFNVRISYNTKMLRADGSEGWYLHQVKILHIDENNKPLFGFKLISDISDFKKDDAIDFVISKKNEAGVFKKVYSCTFVTQKKVLPISIREVEVLALIGEGNSSKQIAAILYISEHTVFNHRKNILKRLEVKTIGEALKKAMAHGIL